MAIAPESRATLLRVVCTLNPLLSSLSTALSAVATTVLRAACAGIWTPPTVATKCPNGRHRGAWRRRFPSSSKIASLAVHRRGRRNLSRGSAMRLATNGGPLVTRRETFPSLAPEARRRGPKLWIRLVFPKVPHAIRVRDDLAAIAWALFAVSVTEPLTLSGVVNALAVLAVRGRRLTSKAGDPTCDARKPLDLRPASRRRARREFGSSKRRAHQIPPSKRFALSRAFSFPISARCSRGSTPMTTLSRSRRWCLCPSGSSSPHVERGEIVGAVRKARRWFARRADVLAWLRTRGPVAVPSRTVSDDEDDLEDLRRSLLSPSRRSGRR